MLHQRSINAAIVAMSLLSTPIIAQIYPPGQFADLTAFPNEQTANVTHYLTQALSLVTDPRIYQYFQDQCITQQIQPALFTTAPAYVNPFSPFSNLYFVGHTRVSSWAYDTGDGLLVIDSLDNPDEMQGVMLPMLKSFGYTGEDVKALIITHEHVDHYGGAKYLHDTFNVSVYASTVWWDALTALPSNSTPAPPARHQTLDDGQDLTLGNVTFHTVLTPGHTPGTLSLIFPVYENGTAHMAGLSGGTGTPKDATGREQKILSQEKFAEAAREKDVDVLVSNHQVADHAVFNADILEHRGAGVENPFIISTEAFVNYMEINALGSRVVAARDGMDLQV